MKRFNPIFCIILLSALSCTQELTWENKSDANQLEVRIRGDIEHRAATKADDKGFYDGDAFGVYIINSGSSLAQTGNIADNVRFVYDAASTSWTPNNTVYFPDPNQNVSIMGYYPYKDDLEDPSVYPFEVSKDQRKPAANGILGGYEASDFLYAAKSDIKPTSDVISLLFKHKFANMKVTLLEGAGWADGEWNQVSKDVLVTNTIRLAVIDLADGSVQTEGGDRSMGIVPMDMGNDVWRAVVIPQEIPSGSPILTVTIDGQARDYVWDGTYYYYDGKQNSITLSVNKNLDTHGIDLVLVSEGITLWEDEANVRDESAKDFLMIQCAEAGKLKETIQAQGYQLESIQSLKIEGILNQEDFHFMRDELPILQAVNLMEIKTIDCSYDNVPEIAAIPPWAFGNKQSLTKIVFPKGLTTIGNDAFTGTSLKGDLVFPEGLIIVDGFGGIKTLNGTISFPSSLKEIRWSAFGGSTIRGELVLPEGLEIVSGFAFSGTSITHVSFPSTLKEIGPGAFNGCSNLTGSITIPNGQESVGQVSFTDSPMGGNLILPEGLKSIGMWAFYGCQLTGPLVIPSTVELIEERAFRDNKFSSITLPSSLKSLDRYSFDSASNQSGFDLIIPEEITDIPYYCFSSLSINNLYLPKKIEHIDEGAFAYCYNICSITCDALEPPVLESGAFDGVAKDNFAVEVPESSVELYQNAPGWSEFKRIVAHRDFSISRRLVRTLNAGGTRTFTLRAESGASWTVESKPDWVTVSPISGTGKQEVAVSVSALAAGSASREGEIVYKLDGKDYTVSTKVEQYDYQYGDGDVYTVQTHSKGNGVHLVFMGDCYDAKDISEGKYLDNTMEAVEHFFAIEPYNTYRDYFDIHIVFGCSEDSGIGDINTIREAKFGSQYSLKEGVMFNDDECFNYSAKVNPFAPSIAGICLVINTDLEDGVTYLYDNDMFISLCPMGKNQYPNDFRGIIQHEVGGHGFGKLADERIIHPSFVQSCSCLCCPHILEFSIGKAHGWYDNLSLSGDMKKVPWSHLIYDPKYSDIVDIYEGGFYHARGIFRSEANSCMRNKIPYYSTISRESIVKRIKRYAGERYTFDAFKANDVTGAFVSTKSNTAWVFPEYDTGHHREPVMKGTSPEINTNR